MENIKDVVAKRFVGEKYHFKCDCLFPLDLVGIIKDYKIHNEEIIFLVSHNNKIIEVGLNHPKMKIEKVS